MLIGIIEDDRWLNQALQIALKKAGYKVRTALSMQEALRSFDGSEALFVIDIGLPDGDGICLYRKLREKRNIPAVFLTAKDEEEDMLTAFDAGAEDYVVKPFSIKVLLKRIETVLRRNRGENLLLYRDLVLDTDRKQASVKGREVSLTAKEYQLLEYLMNHQGRVLSKENILEHIWGIDGSFVVENLVSVTVNRLRKKIEPDVKEPVYIRNVFGLGYKIGE